MRIRICFILMFTESVFYPLIEPCSYQICQQVKSLEGGMEPPDFLANRNILNSIKRVVFLELYLFMHRLVSSVLQKPDLIRLVVLIDA